MIDVIGRFRSILSEHELHMKLFDHCAVQVEGWLKGELLPFFEAEKAYGILLNYWPESSPKFRTIQGRKRIDYELQLFDSTKVWIELKHFQIGHQKGELWKAQNYFIDKNIGIYNDVVKLQDVVEGDKYIFILATKNPGMDDWSRGLHKFNEKFSHLYIQSHTAPSNFPATYFLGLLKVS